MSAPSSATPYFALVPTEIGATPTSATPYFALVPDWYWADDVSAGLGIVFNAPFNVFGLFN